jgi:hypothetical protein
VSPATPAVPGRPDRRQRHEGGVLRLARPPDDLAAVAVDELHIARRFVQIFRDGFGAAGRSTLAVVCFPLGTRVGGAVKLVLAGEVFSQEWRDLVARRAGMASPVNDSASLYGTADAGVLGNETPLSVSIRRFLAGRHGRLRVRRAASVRHQLQRRNSEYAHYVPADQQLPQMQPRAADDAVYFPVGVKHRYTRQGPGN